jgi:hypothetical protein
MAKKETKGRVIELSKEDKLLFKKYLIALEEIGIEKKPALVASELFSIGLHNEYEMLSHNK